MLRPKFWITFSQIRFRFSALTPRLQSGVESPGLEPRHPLICRVYTASLVYSLVALNYIKHHPECTKTHHFQIRKIYFFFNSGEGHSNSGCGRDPALLEVVTITGAIKHGNCKAPVKMSPPTNQHPVLFTSWMPFLSPNQQYQSTEGKEHTDSMLLNISGPFVVIYYYTIKCGGFPFLTIIPSL